MYIYKVLIVSFIMSYEESNFEEGERMFAKYVAEEAAVNGITGDYDFDCRLIRHIIIVGNSPEHREAMAKIDEDVERFIKPFKDARRIPPLSDREFWFTPIEAVAY